MSQSFSSLDKANVNTIKILLADDDKDDRFFFGKALKALPIPTELLTFANGQILMDYLLNNPGQFADVLFLDLNMPRKNGAECLLEIKKNPDLKQLPVIIYSTSLNIEVADVLFANGAHYYLQKTDYSKIKDILLVVLTMISEKRFEYPTREKFILQHN